MADYHLTNYGCRAFKKNEVWQFNNDNVNRLHYVVSGKGYYILNGEKIYFKPGCIYIIPPFFDYNTGYDKDIGFKHMYFDFFSARLFGFEEPLCLEASEHESIQGVLNMLTSFFADCDRGLYDKEKKKIHITRAFTFLMELIDDCYNIRYVADERIEKILRYIHENYANDITVDDMANHLYLNKSYFSKMFMEKVKMSPHEYLIYYRVIRGIEMIKKGQKISDVAEKVGYKNANSFSTAVRKYTGSSPKANKLSLF